MDAGASLAGSFVGAPSEVRFGRGAVRQLAEILDRDGVSRALLVTGRTLAANPDLLGRVEAAMGRRLAGVFSATEAHVPRDTAIAAAALARSLGADALVSFGGSTQNDTAKGAAWALAEGLTDADDFESYAIHARDGKRIAPGLTGAAVPIYAIPTTLSAGEFTDIAGLTDRRQRHKQLYRDRRIASRTVFLDPELTLATPERLWLSSGVKAIDHCVEAFVSLHSQPYTEALAAQALGLLMRDLAATKADPGDLDARMNCQIAAWLSLAGLANVSLGLSHALGHQLGAVSAVPHGLTACVVLYHVVAFNREAVAGRQQRLLALARTFAPVSGLAPASLDEAILGLVRERLRLPWRLRDVGVDRADFPEIARRTLGDMMAATNPRAVHGEADVIALLERAW